jgi:hypothetical protein
MNRGRESKSSQDSRKGDRSTSQGSDSSRDSSRYTRGNDNNRNGGTNYYNNDRNRSNSSTGNKHRYQDSSPVRDRTGNRQSVLPYLKNRMRQGEKCVDS